MKIIVSYLALRSVEKKHKLTFLDVKKLPSFETSQMVTVETKSEYLINELKTAEQENVGK